MSNKPVTPTLEDILEFATNLRISLEKLRAETTDGNIREYVDYLLTDDQYDLKK